MAGPAVCIVIEPVCSATNVGSGLASSLFSTAVSWVAGSSDWAWRELGSFLSSASSPSVVIGAADAEYRALLVVAPIVAAIALLATVLTGLTHGNPGQMVRDVTFALPVLVLAIVAAEPFATLALDVTNALCSAATTNAAAALAQVNTDVVTAPSSVPGFADLLLALAGVVGAMLLWFELVLRNAVLSLLLCLSPVIFAAAIWSPLRRLAVRLVETFMAVALAKFIVVVALAMGASAATSNSGEVELTGIAVVLLATLTPYALLRVVPLLENSAVHAFDGMRQRATAGARRTANATANGLAMLGPQPPTGPPERPEDLGLEEWPETEFPSFPEPPAEPVVPPVGKPTLRRGHVAYRRDEHGPVIGWHFDE